MKNWKSDAVSNYEERTDEAAQMSEREIRKAESRSNVDQIEDYHATHPTLSVDVQFIAPSAEPKTEASVEE